MVLPAGLPSEAANQSGNPARTLNCARNQAPYCDVSCVTTDGKVLFVFDRVQAVFVTEFAAAHTLLEIQRTAPSEIVSVLIGQISHCTLNGLQDSSLAGQH
jgi:hypothetical protein